MYTDLLSVFSEAENAENSVSILSDLLTLKHKQPFYKQTDRRTHRKTKSQTDKLTDRQTHRRTNSQADKLTDRQINADRRIAINKETDKRKDRQTHKQTNARTDKRKERRVEVNKTKTDKHTETQTAVCHILNEIIKVGQPKLIC